MLLQEKGGRYSTSVAMGSHQGKQAVAVDQYGTVEMTERKGKFGPIEFSDIRHDRRWVSPKPYDLALPIDNLDKLRTISNPQNEYVEAGRMAIARKQDDIVRAAFFGTAKTGVDGDTSETFDTGTYQIANDVGAAAATGLNVEKVKKVIQTFLDLSVDIESDPIFMAITPQQNYDLMNEEQVINGDYRGAKVLDGNGMLKSFLGVNFIHDINLTNDGTNYLLPAWVKSGMHYGTFDPEGSGPLSVDIDKRKDLEGHPTQIYFQMQAGATRTQAGKILQVLAAV